MLEPASIAILYQASPPPAIDGLRKAAKPGSYSDSGADIGFTLKAAGLPVVTPAPSADPAVASDWVFPDTAAGIHAALTAGAQVIWANTVLFNGHPLEEVLGTVAIVGQLPSAMQAFDDEFATNLAGEGRPAGRPLVPVIG